MYRKESEGLRKAFSRMNSITRSDNFSVLCSGSSQVMVDFLQENLNYGRTRSKMVYGGDPEEQKLFEPQGVFTMIDAGNDTNYCVLVKHPGTMFVNR